MNSLFRLLRGREKISAADQAWVDAIEATYLTSEFGHLRIFADGRNAGLDYAPFMFGGYYRCVETVNSNGGGTMEAGEEAWFLGYYVFPYDGVLRLHLHDGRQERLLTFVDVYPETETLIRSTFLARPERYFEPAPAPSAKAAGLAALRDKVLSLRRRRQ
jgi:hypothetical protein